MKGYDTVGAVILACLTAKNSPPEWIGRKGPNLLFATKMVISKKKKNIKGSNSGVRKDYSKKTDRVPPFNGHWLSCDCNVGKGSALLP